MNVNIRPKSNRNESFLFRYLNHFLDHKKNHFCGYGSLEARVEGICGANSIKKYFERKLVNN
jgi:hypothetical protein